MVRTQIEITEEQAAGLRTLSVERRQPVAELIRMCIDSFLRNEAVVGREHKIAQAKSAAGRFASSRTDISAEHDKYLAEAFGER
ncbi:MAG: CopG family transcriptional regulator [Bryobacterales bacterium]|nr:CopG family transcriptional regulator [Bryobacterales bacterium]